MTAIMIAACFQQAYAQCNKIDAVAMASFKITGGEACSNYANLNWSFTKKNGVLTIEWGTTASYGAQKALNPGGVSPVKLPNLTPSTTYNYHVWGVYENKTHEYTKSTFITSAGGAAPNNPPVITCASAVACTTSKTTTCAVTATDPDNDPVTFTLSGQPSWITFASPTLTLKPVTGSVNSTVKIFAADGKGGLDTLNLAVTVIPTTSIATQGSSLRNCTFYLGNTQLNLQNVIGDHIGISLYSLDGTRIMSRSVPAGNSSSARLSLPPTLVPGIYFARISDSVNSRTQTVNIRE